MYEVESLPEILIYTPTFSCRSESVCVWTFVLSKVEGFV